MKSHHLVVFTVSSARIMLFEMYLLDRLQVRIGLISDERRTEDIIKSIENVRSNFEDTYDLSRKYYLHMNLKFTFTRII